MRTFLTEYRTDDGRVWAGPNIQAIGWDDAEQQARRMDFHSGLAVVGELVAEIDERTGKKVDFDYYLN